MASQTLFQSFFFPDNCSYNFLHLTIQEFLAACHVSHLSHQKQEQLLLRSREEHHFKNMMTYVAGLTKFEGIEDIMETVIVVKDDGGCRLDDYGLELLFECQKKTRILGKDTYSATLLQSSTPRHFLALGSIIANSKCKWRLELELPDGFKTEMLVQGFNTNTKPYYTVTTMAIKSTSKDNVFFTQDSKYFSARIQSLIVQCSIDKCFFQWLPSCSKAGNTFTLWY